MNTRDGACADCGQIFTRRFGRTGAPQESHLLLDCVYQTRFRLERLPVIVARNSSRIAKSCFRCHQPLDANERPADGERAAHADFGDCLDLLREALDPSKRAELQAVQDEYERISLRHLRKEAFR